MAHTRSKIRVLFYDTWFLEYCAVSSSLALTLTIVSLLAYFDGRNLAAWNLPYYLTVNTVVSIINTASKSLLIYALSSSIGQWKWILATKREFLLHSFVDLDLAGRGPLGCFHVLRRLRWSIPSIGAVAIILALASDPFAQQVITFAPQTQWIDSSPYAVIPRATICCGSLDTGEPLFTMDSAIAEGLGANSSSALQLVPFNCSTSLCDYGSFSSMGVCEHCFDITANMTISAEVSDAGGRNVTLKYEDLYMTNPAGLIDGLNDSYLYQLFNHSMSPFQTSPQLPLSEMGIATFRTIKILDNDSLMRWPNSLYSALQCDLAFCIQKVTSNFSQGRLQETVVAPLPAQLINTSEVKNGSDTFYNFADPDLSPQSLSDLFIDTDTIAMLYKYFNSTWNSLGFWQPGIGYLRGTTAASEYGTIDASMPNYWDGTAEVLYDSKSIVDSFANLANAMSQEARRSLFNYADAWVYGTTGTVHTIIVVRWAWLALPSLTVFLGIVFVLLTARVTAKTQTPLWKGDLLPVLFHGLDRRDFRDACVLSDERNIVMDEKAREILVRLRRNADGGGFLDAARRRSSMVDSTQSFTRQRRASTAGSASIPWGTGSQAAGDHEILLSNLGQSVGERSPTSYGVVQDASRHRMGFVEPGTPGASKNGQIA